MKVLTKREKKKLIKYVAIVGGSAAAMVAIAKVLIDFIQSM